jgi:hypothetical protein
MTGIDNHRDIEISVEILRKHIERKFTDDAAT